MKKFKVALLYSLKGNAPQEATDEDAPWDKWNELDSEKSVAGYERALRLAGHEVIPLEGDHTLIDNLLKYKPDICFNTCEGHYGKSREAQVPAVLDMLRVPYTGSGVMSLAIALDKAMTKRVLQFYSIPTPAFQVFVTGDEPVDARLNFPLIAKPSLEGSGIGITGKSICRTPRDLREQVRYLLRAYSQPVLVEEYIEGREVTTGILGNLMPRGAWIKAKKRIEAARNAQLQFTGQAGAEAGSGNGAHTPVTGTAERKTPVREFYYSGVRVLPPLEIDFTPLTGEPPLYNSEIKANNPWGPRYLCPAPLTVKLTEQIGRSTVATFRALECYDFARVDFRIRASDNQPLVIEINPLPGLTEALSDIVLEADAAGMSYAELINTILDSALRRYGMLDE
jgi:D-alanine-D-alanine ligase